MLYLKYIKFHGSYRCRSFKMAPNLFGNSATLFLEASQGITEEKPVAEIKQKTSKDTETEKKYTWKIVWRNVIAFAYLHIGAFYGLYLFFAGAKLWTSIFSKFNRINTSLLILPRVHLNARASKGKILRNK